VSRRGEDILLSKLEDEAHLDENEEDLLNINCQNGNYQLESNMIGDYPGIADSEEVFNSKAMWLVVKSVRHLNDGQGYPLQVGDFIKLGRARYRIKELGMPLSYKE